MDRSWRPQGMVVGQAQPGFFHVQTHERELIRDAVVNWDRVRVRNSIDPLTKIAYDLGIPPWNMRIEDATLILKRSDEHHAALSSVLTIMHHPKSAVSLTRLREQDLASFFGLNEKDIEKVISWMRSQGLESMAVSPIGTSIRFSGNLLALESAFETEFRRFRWQGKECLANVCQLSIPAAFSAVVGGFYNFSNFGRAPKR